MGRIRHNLEVISLRWVFSINDMVLTGSVQTLVSKGFNHLVVLVVVSNPLIDVLFPVLAIRLSHSQRSLRGVLPLDVLRFQFWKRLVMGLNFQHLTVWKRSYHVVEHHGFRAHSSLCEETDCCGLCVWRQNR